MDGIDPRLRQAAPQQFDQPHRSSGELDGPAAQAVGYDGLAQSRPSQLQHHQYYGISTPGSHSNGAHQESPGSPYDGQPVASGADLSDLKRPRACEACRQLKVRCDPADGSSSGPCRRCLKADRPCVVTAPSRKRQKKTDSRVADLEKKIDALTATLQNQRGPYGMNPALDPAVAHAQMAELEQQRNQLYNQQSWQDGVGNSPDTRESNHMSPPRCMTHPTGAKRKVVGEGPAYNPGPDCGERPPSRRATTTTTTTTTKNPACVANGFGNGHVASTKDGPADSYVDVVDQKMIDRQTAYRIFDRYHNEMRLLPVVVFPPETKAEEIRRSKPLLFLAILAAACHTIRADLQSALLTELLSLLADRIIRHGEKSFELVQTLQVTTIFYQPPEKYEELNFNQLIHMAAVMGIDLGMGKRTRAGSAAPLISRMPMPDADAAETRRAWLGLYFLCANAAMSLRRPLLVRWSPYMDESLEIMDKAPDALPSDKWLIYLVRAQHVAEEVGYQFSMDDPPSEVSITDPKIQYQMKTFERQLEECRRDSTPDMPQGLLKHTEAILDLYVHEIGMHHAHNVDDFRPPYGVEDETEDQPDYITPAHIHSLTVCLDSIHKAFDAFTNMPLSTIAAMPTLFLVRNSYAAVALIKMHNAVSRRGSRFGSVFKPKDLKVDYYLDALLETSRRACEHGTSRVAAKFALIFSMLREWQAKRGGGVLAKHETSMMSAKNLIANWGKSQPAAGLNPQDPKTASWSAPTSTSTSTSNPKGQHPSGLQMLSEAAMGNDKNSADATTTTSTTTAAAAAMTSLAATSSTSVPNNARWGPPGQGQPFATSLQADGSTTTTTAATTGQQGQFGLGAMSMAVPEMENFALTAEELGTLGSMMENPAWLSFGLEGGGWVM